MNNPNYESFKNYFKNQTIVRLTVTFGCNKPDLSKFVDEKKFQFVYSHYDEDLLRRSYPLFVEFDVPEKYYQIVVAEFKKQKYNIINQFQLNI